MPDHQEQPQESQGNKKSDDYSMDDFEGLSEPQTEAKLQAYRQAIEEEYETSLDSDPENVEEYTRDFFKKNIHMAAAQVVHLAGTAESETVRLNASKYIVEAALADSRADGDPIRDLMNKLTKPEKAKA